MVKKSIRNNIKKENLYSIIPKNNIKIKKN